MTDDEEMKDLEARMSARLFAPAATRAPVVEQRKLRGPTWAKIVRGHIEVVLVEAAAHRNDERFDIVRVLEGGGRVKIRSGAFRDEVDAALKPYEADGMEIVWPTR
jgi:hypothetical protein